ncbi:MAG: 50S ribosomal protein L32 [Thermodesulfobacteriota bacterium]|nr:50S ribosomal protein L32 [Thermodesulfobacteriota bacterium]
MALPKRRLSKSRKRKRRTHDRLSLVNMTTCDQCGEAKLPHHVCPHCGTYKGREVIKIEEI